jgi:hypothetical protein
VTETTTATETADAPEVEEVPFLDVEPKSNKPKYFVAGDTFIGQTSDQGELRVKLTFKTKLVRAIRDKGDELDQFIALMDGIGDSKSIAQLDELDIFETTEIVSAFFQAFAQKQDARLGESSRSSK